MYFVTKHVVPKEHVAVWAWVIGWCNFLGQAAGVASLAYTIAQMILATVVMNSDIVDGSPAFKPFVCSLALLFGKIILANAKPAACNTNLSLSLFWFYASSVLYAL
jgi:hypothetical protein